MDLHDYGGHWYVCLELRVHESFVLGHSVWTFEIFEFLRFLADTLDLCMFDKEPGVVSCFFWDNCYCANCFISKCLPLCMDLL